MLCVNFVHVGLRLCTYNLWQGQLYRKFPICSCQKVTFSYIHLHTHSIDLSCSIFHYYNVVALSVDFLVTVMLNTGVLLEFLKGLFL